VLFLWNDAGPSGPTRPWGTIGSPGPWGTAGSSGHWGTTWPTKDWNTSPNPNTSPSGTGQFTSTSSPYTRYQYQLIAKSLDWYSALRYCGSIRAGLVVIGSAREQAELTKFLSREKSGTFVCYGIEASSSGRSMNRGAFCIRRNANGATQTAQRREQLNHDPNPIPNPNPNPNPNPIPHPKRNLKRLF